MTYDDVDWDVQGTSKEFHLDYSYDGGITWKRLLENYDSPGVTTIGQCPTRVVPRQGDGLKTDN